MNKPTPHILFLLSLEHFHTWPIRSCSSILPWINLEVSYIVAWTSFRLHNAMYFSSIFFFCCLPCADLPLSAWVRNSTHWDFLSSLKINFAHINMKSLCLSKNYFLIAALMNAVSALRLLLYLVCHLPYKMCNLPFVLWVLNCYLVLYL